MSHFYGRLRGSRGPATRCGTKNSGVAASADGWNIGGTVYVEYNKEKDRDEVTFCVGSGSGYGAGHKYIGTYYRKGNKLIKVRN